MKKHFGLPLTSLRSGPILVIGLMIVPLLLLGVGAILSHRTATNALAETTTEIVKEIEPVSNLQLAVAQAVMPPNDYIILHYIRRPRRARQLHPFEPAGR